MPTKSHIVTSCPKIDTNSTSRAEIALVNFRGNALHWSEFVLVDVDRSIPGSISLVFECRFHSPQITKHRILTCDICLSFNTSSPSTPLVIASPTIIEPERLEEIVVTKTKSSRARVGIGMSYFASLRGTLSRGSTQRWSVIEKETQEATNRGSRTVFLGFRENRVLKTGLNGHRRVVVRIDNTDGVSCMQGTFGGTFGYTSINAFGFMASYKDEVVATFDLIL